MPEVKVRASRPSPWYRHPMVWMVLAIPASAVLMGVVMLVLANATWDGLVADDYYERGMQIGRSLARDAEAARHGVAAALTFPAPGLVQVRLTGGAGAHDGAPLALRFARAARQGADVTVRLAPGPDGLWTGHLPELPSGKWYVELGNETWRLTAPVRTPMPAAAKLVLEAPAERPPR